MNRVTIRGLMGAVAGIAMVSGAQAADLPVKAKPVEYVKICSAYGAGFYYIPGTDICLRVGGYAFIETGVKGRAAVPLIYNYNNVTGYSISKADNYVNWRSRGTVILDARQNTSYGTLRTYIALGADYNDNLTTTATTAASGGTVTPYLERAFIEFAGFTFGFTESFYSFGAPGYSILANASVPWDWTPLIAYTANLGNGVTASVSIENGTHARMGIVTGTFTGTATGTGAGYAGNNMPDIAGNINVSQAWGSAQVMAAAHEVRPLPTALAGVSSKWGYAVGAGIDLKTPQTGNPNNSFRLQGSWTKGYIEKTGISASPLGLAGGAGLAFGGTGPASDFFDAYYTAATTSLDLTKAWSAYAAYRHYWTPALRTAFYLGYTKVNPGGNSATAAGGDPDFRIWQAGLSNVWSPVTGLDLSLDIMYSDLSTGSCAGAAAAVQAAFCNQSEGLWTGWTRIRRNF